jgi:hypothetical protein
MKTLEEFLHERAEIERGRADEKKAIQQEWIGAVRRLLDQMTEWLRDADPEHLLKIKECDHKLREIDVGVYTAPGLEIRLGTQDLQVIPVARHVVGRDLSNGLVEVARAFGRVDLTDGDKSFLLFRSRKDPDDEWVVLEDDGLRAKRFDRESFEEAMIGLLE